MLDQTSKQNFQLQTNKFLEEAMADDPLMRKTIVILAKIKEQLGNSNIGKRQLIQTLVDAINFHNKLESMLANLPEELKVMYNDLPKEQIALWDKSEQRETGLGESYIWLKSRPIDELKAIIPDSRIQPLHMNSL